MLDNCGFNDQFVSALQNCSEDLISKLQNKQFDEAYQLIKTINPSADHQVYTHVGNLTRSLHDAIVNFNVDVGTSLSKNNSSEMSDASDRLQYVISMTQQAADKTMDRVEAAAPIAAGLGQEAAALKAELEKLRHRELTKEDLSQLYDRMDEFFEQMDDGATQLSDNLQAIILEQGFQDLTGQVLKKVIGLVTDVESELVNLVRIAGKVDEAAGLVRRGAVRERAIDVKGEGPQIYADLREDVVNGQDDVDDLLSSLGF